MAVVFSFCQLLGVSINFHLTEFLVVIVGPGLSAPILIFIELNFGYFLFLSVE